MMRNMPAFGQLNGTMWYFTTAMHFFPRCVARDGQTVWCRGALVAKWCRFDKNCLYSCSNCLCGNECILWINVDALFCCAVQCPLKQAGMGPCPSGGHQREGGTSHTMTDAAKLDLNLNILLNFCVQMFSLCHKICIMINAKRNICNCNERTLCSLWVLRICGLYHMHSSATFCVK